MKTKKTIALLLTAMMAAAAFSGCGGSDDSSSTANSDSSTSTSTESGSTATDSEDITTVTWHLPVDQEYSSELKEQVFAAVNEYLGEKCGVNIEFHTYDYGTYTTKLNTMLTAGDKMDIYFASPMNTTYSHAIALGAAQPIEDLLETCAPEAMEQLPEFLWTAATVNDHIYGFPAYKDNAFVASIIYNKTMADELGIDVSSYVNSDGTYDSFEEQVIPMLYDAKEKRDAAYPDQVNIPISKYYDMGIYQEDFSTGINANLKGIESYAGMGTGEKVFCMYMTPEYLEACQRKRQLVIDGILPSESNYDSDLALRNSGKIFLEGQTGVVNVASDYFSSDFEVASVKNNSSYLTTDYILYGVSVVSNTCENPEAAVKALNYVNTDNYVANTLHFGIEGEDYILTDDNRVSFEGTRNEDPSARSWYYWYGWTYGNIFAMSLPEGQADTLWTDLQGVNETAAISENLGFTFDTTGLENQIASISAVCTEYRSQMEDGFMDNLEEIQQNFTAKLEASGINDVIAACQEQLNTWRAEQGLTVAE